MGWKVKAGTATAATDRQSAPRIISKGDLWVCLPHSDCPVLGAGRVERPVGCVPQTPHLARQDHGREEGGRVRRTDNKRVPHVSKGSSHSPV